MREIDTKAHNKEKPNATPGARVTPIIDGSASGACAPADLATCRAAILFDLP